MQNIQTEVVEVDDNAIGITINQTYNDRMSSEELYEYTRGIWVIGERRYAAEIALALYHGIVKEVYEIKTWHPAGTTEYQHRKFDPVVLKKRFEFVGKVAIDLREKYVGKRIKYLGEIFKSTQNPIRYFNC
ncbi:MAG: hypothetical protein LH606_22855 [Cytophagaceae bacterium]|nr:hypothetical protein [Cytophagaceae bacterium]